MTLNPVDGEHRAGFAVQRRAALAGLALLLVAGTAGAQQAAPGFENPNDWPQYHRTSNAWRFSPD